MKSTKLGYIYILITIVFFSTYEVVSKTLVNRVNPFQVNFLRFFIGGILLFFVVLAKGDIAIELKDLGKVMIVGVTNVVLSMNLLQLSLNMPGSKASMAAVIFSSNPIFVTLFAALINGEKINLNKIIGLMFGVLGVLLISINGIKIAPMDLRSPVLALLSALLYGLYTVLGGKVSKKICSLKVNSYSFLLGRFALFPVFVFFRISVI